MATRGELLLSPVAPVQIVDTGHVCRDVPRGRGGFLEKEGGNSTWTFTERREEWELHVFLCKLLEVSVEHIRTQST